MSYLFLIENKKSIKIWKNQKIIEKITNKLELFQNQFFINNWFILC
jgi:hypothetical protein